MLAIEWTGRVAGFSVADRVFLFFRNCGFPASKTSVEEKKKLQACFGFCNSNQVTLGLLYHFLFTPCSLSMQIIPLCLLMLLPVLPFFLCVFLFFCSICLPADPTQKTQVRSASLAPQQLNMPSTLTKPSCKSTTSRWDKCGKGRKERRKIDGCRNRRKEKKLRNKSNLKKKTILLLLLEEKCLQQLF